MDGPSIMWDGDWSDSMAVDRRTNSRRLKLIIAFGVALATGAWDAAASARAQYQMAPWCAYLNNWGGSSDCSYYSFQQCMATASGLGNICMRNPLYVPPPGRQRRARR
jgi:Protein of unknown function (DUF3551)